MDDRTELTEAEREALAKWAVAFYRPDELYATIAGIVAARVSALSRDLAAAEQRVREEITGIPDAEPTEWTAVQWRANASYWYERAQEAYRYRDAAARDLAAQNTRIAAAWDEGYKAGHSNAMRRMSDEPNAPTSPNPYRALSVSDPGQDKGPHDTKETDHA